MANTPPGQFPVIGDGTTVKFKLGALIALMSTLLGATVWATIFYMKQTRLEEWCEKADQRLERIERALGVSLSQTGFRKESNP